MKKNRLLILCDYPFPNGLAATNRIYAYSKGLMYNDLNVVVLTLSQYGIMKDGKYSPITRENGVVCLHPHFYFINGNKFLRFVDVNLFKIKGFFYLLNFCLTGRIETVFISFDKKVLLSFFLPLLKLFKIKIGFISDEYPPDIRLLKNKLKLFNYLFYRIAHKFFNYRIVISQNLKNYYNDKFGVKPSFVLNSIIDVKSFLYSGQEELRKLNIITYLGNCELSKDNIDNIILAFNHIKNSIPDFVLHIYGSPNKSDLLYLSTLINNLGINGKVLLKGRVSSRFVPVILAESKVLVTSQPATLRAMGGFPTKLGEYLLSGTPSILTDVGEIKNYIEDGVNGFLVPPEDYVLYASKLLYVIKNYEFAEIVGIEGKNYILNNFTSEIVGKELVSFLKENV